MLSDRKKNGKMSKTDSHGMIRSTLTALTVKWLIYPSPSIFTISSLFWMWHYVNTMRSTHQMRNTKNIRRILWYLERIEVSISLHVYPTSKINEPKIRGFYQWVSISTFPFIFTIVNLMSLILLILVKKFTICVVIVRKCLAIDRGLKLVKIENRKQKKTVKKERKRIKYWKSCEHIRTM